MVFPFECEFDSDLRDDRRPAAICMSALQLFPLPHPDRFVAAHLLDLLRQRAGRAGSRRGTRHSRGTLADAPRPNPTRSSARSKSGLRCSVSIRRPGSGARRLATPRPSRTPVRELDTPLTRESVSDVLNDHGSSPCGGAPEPAHREPLRSAPAPGLRPHRLLHSRCRDHRRRRPNSARR